jgi:propanediol dehydratase small subunit
LEQNPFFGSQELTISDIPSLSVSDISALSHVPINDLTTGSYTLGHQHGFCVPNVTYTGPSLNSFGSWTMNNITHDDLEFNKVKIKSDSIEMPADSDIKFGDVSLKTLLNDIADRLNVLIPDDRLEKEYEELRQAREHYEHVKQKLTVLEKLKNTPVELPK